MSRRRFSIHVLAIVALFAGATSLGAVPLPNPDLAYGGSGDGIARIAVASVPADDAFALHATVQADGRLVLVGSTRTTVGGTSTSQLVLARFDTQGLADSGFGAGHDGLYRTAFLDTGGPLSGLFADVAQTGDGKLVYSGHGSSATIIVGRLNGDGTPDASFASGGRRLIGASALVDGALDASFATLLPLTGDKTLALGVALVQTSATSYNAFSCAMRLAADGSTDTSFGTAGRTCIAPMLTSGATSVTAAGHVLADGHILLAGASVHSGGSAADMSVARLGADGTLDTGFGPDHDGWAFVAFDQGGTLNDGATAIALDAAGRILLAGSFDTALGSDIAVARLLSDGRPDPSFGFQGRVQITLTSGSNHIDQANSIVALPNGGILVGALVNSQAGVSIALMPDGTMDPGFGVDGIYYPPQATPRVRSRKQILAGDYLYWAGESVNTDNHLDFAATRAVMPLFADGFDQP
ncbi:MAG: hypothetical protein ABIS07_00160 [Dokdonella sp.]